MRATANNIRGITVEINGETQGLQNALRDVNRQSTALQGELREVDRALRLDPSNITLLSQRNQILANEVSNARDKLERLQHAQEQVEQQFANGDIGEEQYRAFQRELINTENQLGNLENQLHDSNEAMMNAGSAANDAGDALEGMASKGGKIKSVGDNISKVGEKLLPVTAAIGAAGAASLAAFDEVDSGYDTIITKTGAAGELLDGLTQSADKVFSEMPTEMEDVGVAIGEVNTRFGSTGEELENLSKEFIRFANINGTDLNTAIDGVDSVMMKFNVDSSKASEVLGLLTKVGQDTGLSMDDLQNTLNTNGAVLKEMGLDLTESTNLLAQFEASGVDSTAALAGLKKAQQNATADGKTMQESLNGTIESIKSASNETEPLQIATDLFGKKGAAEMTQAIREGKFSVNDLSTSLSDYKGVVTDTFESTLDPPDQAKIAFNNLKLSGAQLGATILNTVQPALMKLTEKLKSLTSWFKGLTESQKQTILKIAGVVAAIGPLLIVIGKVVSTVGTIMTILPTLKAAIVAINVAMTANPIGIIIAGIGALIAIFAVLWNKCDWFREAWISLWEKIEAAFGFFVDLFKFQIEVIKIVFEALKDFFSEKWEVIKGIFSAVGGWFKDTFGPLFSGAMDGIKVIFGAVKDYISNQWELIKSVFSGIINFVKDVFRGDWSAAWEDIKGIFKSIWDSFEEIAKKPLNAVIGLVNGLIGGINTMIDGLNSIEITVPDWVPKVGGNSVGFKLPYVNDVPYLAKGGILSQGSAVVGEAGAELLTMYNGRAIVQPLGNDRLNPVAGGTYNITNIVKVEKISNDFDVTRINERLAFEQKRQLSAIGG